MNVGFAAIVNGIKDDSKLEAVASQVEDGLNPTDTTEWQARKRARREQDAKVVWPSLPELSPDVHMLRAVHDSLFYLVYCRDEPEDGAPRDRKSPEQLLYLHHKLKICFGLDTVSEVSSNHDMQSLLHNLHIVKYDDIANKHGGPTVQISVRLSPVCNNSSASALGTKYGITSAKWTAVTKIPRGDVFLTVCRTRDEFIVHHDGLCIFRHNSTELVCVPETWASLAKRLRMNYLKCSTSFLFRMLGRLCPKRPGMFDDKYDKYELETHSEYQISTSLPVYTFFKDAWYHFRERIVRVLHHWQTSILPMDLVKIVLLYAYLPPRTTVIP